MLRQNTKQTDRQQVRANIDKTATFQCAVTHSCDIWGNSKLEK